MKRFLKQLLIGSIYLTIFVSIGIAVFNATYVPTCIDKLKNQNEEQTDCGGPCAPCELRTLVAPGVSRKLFFQNDGNTVDVGFQIKNPNSDWGANNLEYRIDFLDASGNVFPGAIYGATYVMPNEAKWIIELAKFVPEGMADVRLTIATSTLSWLKLRPYVGDQDFALKEILFKRLAAPQSGYAEITGIIQNKSGFNVENLDVQTIAYDYNKRVLGISKTTIFALRVGEFREFRIFWPRPFNGEYKSADLFVNVNLLNNENFLQKYGE